MLDIYYDIDNYGFQKNIALPILKDYVNFYQANYQKVDKINENLVKERIGLLFYRNVAIGCFLQREGNDIFDLMGDWSRKHGIMVTNMHAFPLEPYEFCTANYIDPRLWILTIIENKHPELFSPIKPTSIKNAHHELRKLGNMVISGVQDCSSSEELYRCCNYCICYSNRVVDNYLNYDKALAEIARIERDITTKEQTSLLISGL